jgi:hypothetical protein
MMFTWKDFHIVEQSEVVNSKKLWEDVWKADVLRCIGFNDRRYKHVRMFTCNLSVSVRKLV